MNIRHCMRRGLSAGLACLLLFAASCSPDADMPGTTTGTDRETGTAAGTAASETASEGESTEMSTEEETMPVAPTEAGHFADPAHLHGFDSERNGAYLKTTQCAATFNGDGSLTLTGTWSEGEHFSPSLRISYYSLMKNCLDGYSSAENIVNGGEDRRSVVVFTVSVDASVAGDTALSYTAGRKREVTGSAIAAREPVGTGEREYILFDLSDSDFSSAYLHTLQLDWGWGTGDADNIGASVTLYAIDFYASPEEAAAVIGQASQPEDNGNYPLGVAADRLDTLMADIFSGNTVRNETVMFLDPGDVRSLLFRIDEVLSVTSYDGSRVYEEGIDYAVDDGKLIALEGGSIPCITSGKYYGAASDSLLVTRHDGKNVPTHWGEGRAMTDWQVNVTYTHSDTWEGFRQPCSAGVYADFFRKLQNGEDVTVIFYGDSCTYGAASSFAYGYSPFQYSYALLVTNALADLFDYTVHYASAVGPMPGKDYVRGTRGTITYINPSVGGWNSADGVAQYDTDLAPLIARYGCDLFVLDIGGNDGDRAAREVRLNDETILNRVLEDAPGTSLLVMSTMVPNPSATNGWFGKEYLQEPQLIRMAERYRKRGIPCATCCMTSMTLSVLERVDFRDISGNNINHPNDFLARIYACTLFRTLVGYDNLT